MESIDKSGKLLFTVAEIFSEDGYLFQKHKTHFNIPHYQRGYKWEPSNVEKLLDDVNNFEMADGKFYCLQNITIISDGKQFNVIDGQQRLTTLTIILSYLGNKLLVKDKVRFPENSIRKFTNKFINNIITNNDVDFPNEDWEEFIEQYPDYDLQDISHIYNVQNAISLWFKSKRDNKNKFEENFLEKLLNNVKIIVNEVDETTGEEKVFGNLNSKRVPLDGSDLIRAILITRVAREEGRKENDIKNIVYVNERRVKLGWELDQINNWWGREDVKNYFSKFTSIKSELSGSDKKLFDEVKYPINYLYLLFAEKKDGQTKLTLDLIEQHSNNAIALYKEILKLHYTLQDWFEDKEIYHYLGFLFNITEKQKKISFKNVWELWLSSKTRKDFMLSLKKEIKKHFVIDNEIFDYKDLRINWYVDKPSELIRTLILMDVIYSVKTNQIRLPYNCFTKHSNDVEHIFPQNPAELKDKKKYVEFLDKYYSEKNEVKFDLSKFSKKQDDENYIKSVDDYIQNKTSNFAINSIGNLVLLFNKLNKSISNSIYSTKRSRIIEFHNQGNFIQPHTFKVFVRDFNDVNQLNKDYEYWTNDDIVKNSTYINQQVINFFKDI
jgi:uncharacterized protein with ParB-like and HNH nuclease domain